MNTTHSLSRFNVQSLFEYRVISAAAAVVFVLIVGLMSTNVFAADAVVNDDVCVTSGTRVALPADSDTVTVYSGFTEGSPNGFTVTEFDLSQVRGITDEERASNSVVWLASHDSEYADGWTVNLYWYQNHYGVTVTGTTTAMVDGVLTNAAFSDDTGASCIF